jgi:putative membrane protein
MLSRMSDDQRAPDENGAASTGAASTSPAETSPAENGPAESGPAENGPAESGPAASDTVATGHERLPKSVYGVGSEPDVRFSLANERTALAWIRTGLALVAGGVALTTVATIADLPLVIDIVAILASLAGGVLAASAIFSWRRTERALRLGLPLPSPSALPWLVVGVVLLALVLAGYGVFELARHL